MPIIVIVTGEGGSGGALGIAIGDRVLMQEFAVYSVIPPEGCAAILWRDASRKVEAAEALKITAPDLLAPQHRRRHRARAARRRAPGSGRRPRAPSIGRAAAALAEVAALDVDDAARSAATRSSGSIGALGDGIIDRRRRRRRVDERTQCALGAVSGGTAVWLDDRATTRRAALAAALDVPPVVARLLCLRGLGDPEAAARFLAPRLDHLHDPFLLTDLGVAVERLLRRDRAHASASPSTATTTSTASPRR